MIHTELPMATPDPNTRPLETRSLNRLALVGLALFILALWMLIRPNRGIAHDGMIYELYAMARLYPESLGHDFFVRYGTQDHFTIFSPLYAQVIRLLGLDHAAALGILVTQAAFYFAAWWLLRRFTTADRALLGVGLLIFLPSWYGGDEVFSHTEMFFTPRQPAEVFVLLGIGSVVSSRRVAAAACLLASVLLHPIIAAAGILFWIIWEFGLPYPKQALAVFTAGVALCTAVALVPHGPLHRFDPVWLTTLQDRLAYLFPTLWGMQDWNWSIPGLVTLLVGALRASSEVVRKLCAAALATVIAGLILAILGSDLLHVILAAQLQMWRWLWLSGVLGALLLPVIAVDSWHAGLLGRATVLLLTAEWLTPQPPLILGSAALASLCAFGAGRPSSPREQMTALVGACGVLAIAIIYGGNDIQALVHNLPVTHAGRSHLVTRLAQLRLLAGSPPLCTAAMLGVWRLSRSPSPRSPILVTILGLVACAVVIPYSISIWTRVQYPATDTARFEAWRQIIPADAEVLWPDSPPTVVWYSLHRANYWSHLQMAGLVFSRRDLEIGVRRENAMATRIPYLGGIEDGAVARNLNRISPAATLAAFCGVPDVSFLASWRNLGATPYPTVTMSHPLTGRPAPLYLYHCSHDKH